VLRRRAGRHPGSVSRFRQKATATQRGLARFLSIQRLSRFGGALSDPMPSVPASSGPASNVLGANASTAACSACLSLSRSGVACARTSRLPGSGAVLRAERRPLDRSQRAARRGSMGRLGCLLTAACVAALAWLAGAAFAGGTQVSVVAVAGRVWAFPTAHPLQAGGRRFDPVTAHSSNPLTTGRKRWASALPCISTPRDYQARGRSR
jgi:hypothetical protein